MQKNLRDVRNDIDFGILTFYYDPSESNIQIKLNLSYDCFRFYLNWFFVHDVYFWDFSMVFNVKSP